MRSRGCGFTRSTLIFSSIIFTPVVLRWRLGFRLQLVSLGISSLLSLPPSWTVALVHVFLPQQRQK
jgi:hypothetical protein